MFFIRLPIELISLILLLARDTSLAIKIESILLGLHHKHRDASTAYDGLQIEYFPVSKELSERHTWNLSKIPRTLCEMYWIIKFRPHFLMVAHGQLWKQAASQNSFRMFVALQKAKEMHSFHICMMQIAVDAGNCEAVTFLWKQVGTICIRTTLDNAARDGHVAVLELIRSRNWLYFEPHLLTIAAKHGRLEVVRFLSTFMTVTSEAINAAVMAGKLEVVKYLSLFGEVSYTAFAAAASSGHVGTVEYLIKTPWKPLWCERFRNEWALKGALQNCHQDIAMLLCSHITAEATLSPPSERGTEKKKHSILSGWKKENTPSAPPFKFEASILDQCLRKGNLFLVRLFRNPNDPYACDVLQSIGYLGHLHVVRFLVEEVKPRPENLSEIFHGAATGLQVKVLKYLHRRGIRKVMHTDRVMRRGSLETIKLLHKQGNLTFNSFDFETAAASGLLDIVKFLHSVGIEGVTKWAMDNAAGNGELETVKWLHKNRTEGCSYLAMKMAACRNHLEVVKFLNEIGERYLLLNTMDQAVAADNASLDVVKFLHYEGLGRCTKAAMDAAATKRDMSILLFLHFNRTEGCTTRAMDEAARLGMMDTVKFLHKYRKEGCTRRAVEMAVVHGHVDVARFLCQNYFPDFKINA
ncbi:hypothetical protein HDU97_002811 [Phlyctochytrium planicorne]|nr:hypothetical protein HDU97_002811 [Phlyctochytrium planicorne]